MMPFSVIDKRSLKPFESPHVRHAWRFLTIAAEVILGLAESSSFRKSRRMSSLGRTLLVVLRKCLFTSESALRLALAEFQTYFNHERPHQGIDNRTVLGSSDVPTVTGKVVRIPRVGGLLNHYERVA